MLSEQREFRQQTARNTIPLRAFLPNSDPLLRHADPLMWLDAMELIFDEMKADGLDLSGIEAISGSGQQHGSVYLKPEFACTGGVELKGSLHESIAPFVESADRSNLDGQFFLRRMRRNIRKSRQQQACLRT